MDELLFAKQKLLQIKSEVARVRTSDFHHPGVKNVLDIIDQEFEVLLYEINRASPSSDTKRNRALDVNRRLQHFHYVLGVILRSTNTRNSFEIYDPVLRLAKRLLHIDTVLILSSEWDFVPFATPSVFAGVRNCVVVGLPVMEAANALVIPLAGHELGHAVWRDKKLLEQTAADREAALSAVLLQSWETFASFPGVPSKKEEISSRLTTSEWGQIPLSTMAEVCEELFCDMLGVRLFGMGYLYAFEYLAAPSLGETDLQGYPAFDARAGYLADAMRSIVEAEHNEGLGGAPTGARGGEAWPRFEGYEGRFSEKNRPTLEDYDKFLLDSAHQACESLVPRLREIAAEVCGADGDDPELPLPTLKGAKKALKRLRNGLPAVADLADLVNAGWLAYLDPDFWSDVPEWKSGKFRFLNELVFKSLDVTEFTRRQPDAPKG